MMFTVSLFWSLIFLSVDFLRVSPSFPEDKLYPGFKCSGVITVLFTDLPAELCDLPFTRVNVNVKSVFTPALVFAFVRE